ncbi:MAG: hypothetical protein H8E47_02055 [Anaerolineales bacterium]|nr:hypothetical protein [Anaerolineales bacterium]
MNSENRAIRTLGVLIFSAGVLLGMALFASAVWGDLEATLFDVSMRGSAPLTTLRCPVMMTATEVGTVTAAFTNPLERAIEFTIRTHISRGYVTLMREINSKLPLAPGETQTLEWTVTPDDAAYGRLILVGVRLSAKYPLPSRHGSCGILIVNLPYFTGNQVGAFTFAASLLSMVVGAGLWVTRNRPLSGLGLDVTRTMGALAGCVLAGMIVGLLGWWVLGVIILVITVLLISTIIGYFVGRLGN